MWRRLLVVSYMLLLSSLSIQHGVWSEDEHKNEHKNKSATAKYNCSRGGAAHRFARAKPGKGRGSHLHGVIVIFVLVSTRTHTREILRGQRTT